MPWSQCHFKGQYSKMFGPDKGHMCSITLNWSGVCCAHTKQASSNMTKQTDLSTWQLHHVIGKFILSHGNYFSRGDVYFMFCFVFKENNCSHTLWRDAFVFFLSKWIRRKMFCARQNTMTTASQTIQNLITLAKTSNNATAKHVTCNHLPFFRQKYEIKALEELLKLHINT